MTWGSLQSTISGVKHVTHACLTFAGTWEAPGTGYPTDVVNGLAQFVDDGLCVEVPVIAPWTFGPLNAPLGSPSYQQSVQIAVDFAGQWMRDNPTQTFCLIGYSQGAEAASRVLIELQSGSLTQFMPNLIGGITFGSPCRGDGMHAAGTADPSGRGISDVTLTSLPAMWADYVHSPANGDAGLDMYGSVPDNQVGVDMTLVYNIATNFQLNDLGALTHTIVDGFTQGVHDLFPPKTTAKLKEGLAAARGGDPTALVSLIPDLSHPTGLVAAFDALMAGLAFLVAPGGPTAPHISYLGEIGGYSNMVAQAVGFLQQMALAVPARS